jgi:hypothetical protein
VRQDNGRVCVQQAHAFKTAEHGDRPKEISSVPERSGDPRLLCGPLPHPAALCVCPPRVPATPSWVWRSTPPLVPVGVALFAGPTQCCVGRGGRSAVWFGVDGSGARLRTVQECGRLLALTLSFLSSSSLLRVALQRCGGNRCVCAVSQGGRELGMVADHACTLCSCFAPSYPAVRAIMVLCAALHICQERDSMRCDDGLRGALGAGGDGNGGVRVGRLDETASIQPQNQCVL